MDFGLRSPGSHRSLIIVPPGCGQPPRPDEPKALVPLLGRPLLSLDPGRSRRGSLRARRSSPRRPGGSPRSRALAGEGAEVVAGGATRAASVRRAFEACGVGPDRSRLHPRRGAAVRDRRGDRGRAAAAEQIGRRDRARRRSSDTIKRVERGPGRRRRSTGGALRRRDAAGVPRGLLARALESGAEATDEAALCEALGIPVSGRARLAARLQDHDARRSRDRRGDPGSPRGRRRAETEESLSSRGSGSVSTRIRSPRGGRSSSAASRSRTRAVWRGTPTATPSSTRSPTPFSARPGRGSLGEHFPDGSDAWKGADSAVFLTRARDLAAETGFRSATSTPSSIAEAPKIAPHAAGDPGPPRGDPRRRRRRRRASGARARTASVSAGRGEGHRGDRRRAARTSS